ncbi:MAG: hypothetical protein DRH24_15035 [Deltaproteobacteria bacterium]|nr:MAG: hypothetical protein DRH24_15035 [Deltaproteobacteria bacterium]
MEPKDKYFSPPQGLICPLVSPLMDDNTIDSASLERLLEHVGRAVDGVLLCDAIWGEGTVLSAEIRFDLVSSALEIIRGRWPVLIFITGKTLRDTQLFMAQMEELINKIEYRGKLFWVDYPLYYHSNRGLPQMYLELMTKTEIPLIIANLPYLVKQQKGLVKRGNIRTSVLKKIVRNTEIRGMIFTGDLKRSFNYQMAARSGSGFVFYDGDEAVFLKNPGMGGVVAGGSNLVPGKWLEITRFSLNQYDKKKRIQISRPAVLESGTMLQFLYSLCNAAPAVYMKKILCKVGIIDSSHSYSSVESLKLSRQEKAWQDELKVFLNTYDMV